MTRHPGGTKHDILKVLVRQELGAQHLAERLRISAAAVRQHLGTLEALGLVTRRKTSTRPGRPGFLYRLSPEGHRGFPRRYDLLLTQIVDVLAERDGQDAVAGIVRAAARRLADRVRKRFQGVDARGRWELLVRWLEEELTWEADSVEEPTGERRLTIHHCPFQDVAREHPAVCAVFFAALVEELYGDIEAELRPAEQPPACCALVVRPSPDAAPLSPRPAARPAPTRHPPRRG